MTPFVNLRSEFSFIKENHTIPVTIEVLTDFAAELSKTYPLLHVLELAYCLILFQGLSTMRLIYVGK